MRCSVQSWVPRYSFSHPYLAKPVTTFLPLPSFQYTTRTYASKISTSTKQPLQPTHKTRTTKSTCVLARKTRLRPTPPRPLPATSPTLVQSSYLPSATPLATPAPPLVCLNRPRSVLLVVRPFASSRTSPSPVKSSTRLVSYAICALCELN